MAFPGLGQLRSSDHACGQNILGPSTRWLFISVYMLGKKGRTQSALAAANTLVVSKYVAANACRGVLMSCAVGLLICRECPPPIPPLLELSCATGRSSSHPGFTLCVAYKRARCCFYPESFTGGQGAVKKRCRVT